MPPQEPQYLLVDSNENTLGAAYINSNDELVLYHDASGNEVFLTNAGLEDDAGNTFITSVAIEDNGTAVIDATGVDFGTDLDVTDNGDGTVTVDANITAGHSVSDDGTEVLADPTDVNFATNLTVTDDGDGTVSIDASGGGGSTTTDLPAETVRETTDYLQEPKPVEFNDGTLLLVYRRADAGAHGIDSSGRLVAQRSSDGGETWGSEITVVDSSGDDRNPSVVYDSGSDRLTVIYRSYDSNNNLEGLFRVSSTDTGQTYSSRTEITSTTYTPVAAFGDYVETSNGLLTAVITDNSGTRVIEVLFSTDGAQTFGNAVEAIDETQVSGEISEPVPWTATEDKIALHVRKQDAAPGDALQYVVRSSDGGSTWESTVYEMNPFENDYRSYLFAKRALGNQLIGLQNTRVDDVEDGNGPLYGFQIPASVAWDDPSLIDADSEITKFKLPGAGDVEDWGYAQFIPLGESSQELFVAWMDDETDDRTPNIWQANYAVGGVGSTVGSADPSLVTSGSVTLSSGTATVDTGVSTSETATFNIYLGPSTTDADVAADLRADSGTGTYIFDVEETDTSVGDPTVNYDVTRVR